MAKHKYTAYVVTRELEDEDEIDEYEFSTPAELNAFLLGFDISGGDDIRAYTNRADAVAWYRTGEG
jgi:hypothetical protein